MRGYEDYAARQKRVRPAVDLATVAYKPSIELFRDCFLGRTTTRRNGLYSWAVNDWGALEVILALRPHLRVKSAQADLAVAFMGTKVDRPGGERRRPPSAEVAAPHDAPPNGRAKSVSLVEKAKEEIQ